MFTLDKNALMVLKIGDSAPDFSLPDGEGQMFSLSNWRGKRVVVYFYPRDNTPGCTKEACGFKEVFAEYQGEEIVVVGVSMDDAKSHQKFSQKYQLPFPLLSDEGGKVALLYDSYGLKKFMGKEYMGVHRHSFVISPEGQIEKIYTKVKPAIHAQEVLKDILAGG